MSNIGLSKIEKEMLNFNFDEFHVQTLNAQKSIGSAKSAKDVISEICSVWSKIKIYVVLTYNIPIVGKFIKIMGDLLDSICNAK